MSGDEGFLARWSRRKRNAAPSASDKATPKGDASDAPAASVPSGETQSPFDPATLPPIESIGAGSDIRAFLAAGVPVELTRAALRRAWSADPAIRDFIGLSENSWDFNAPGGVPGFGSVTAEDVRRLLGQATGEPEAVDPARPAAETASADHAAAPTGAAKDQPEQDHDMGADRRDTEPRGKVDTAAQHEPEQHDCSPLLPQRRRGGALPE